MGHAKIAPQRPLPERAGQASFHKDAYSAATSSS
jgi:hypothetical protein